MRCAAQGTTLLAGGNFSSLCVQKVLRIVFMSPPLTRLALFAVHDQLSVAIVDTVRTVGRVILHATASVDKSVCNTSYVQRFCPWAFPRRLGILLSSILLQPAHSLNSCAPGRSGASASLRNSACLTAFLASFVFASGNMS